MAKMKKQEESRGELLRRVRRQLGLSQRDLASRLGVDPATLSQYETGAMHVPTHRLDSLLVIAMEKRGEPERLVDEIRAARGVAS